MSTLYQTGTLVALLQGIIEGDTDFDTLSKKGDTGLGTVNGVDGEMIAIDDCYYRIDSTGKVNKIPAQTKTPFSVVSHFHADSHFDIGEVNSLQELEKILDEKLTNKNIFYMLKIEADLKAITLRSMACQTKSMIPMAESLEELQKIFEINETKGFLIATRCPTYFQTMNVEGYHFHYINDQKTIGGHVFELKLKSALVLVQMFRHCEIQLPDNSDFNHADLGINVEAAAHQVEKKRLPPKNS